MSLPLATTALPKPHSLLGQMLLAVAAALLLVQGTGAFLIYRAQSEGLESAMLNAAAFRLVMETRGVSSHFRRHDRRESPFGGTRPRGYRLEYSTRAPLLAGERRDDDAEDGIRKILDDQEFPVTDLIVTHRHVSSDPVASASAMRKAEALGLDQDERRQMLGEHLLVVGVKPAADADWIVARIRAPRAMAVLFWPLVIQTLIIYVVLIGAVALILRRITRPLAALTRRVEHFASTQDAHGQVRPSGPDDMRRLIVAHNAMEGRITAMLNEKDVMLGAIGHDLKTPLSALRVRIESVEDETERAKMAATIEDIVRSLDDILSLARVGRPSDPRERTELSALVASVVEEYEDMGDPVELRETERLVLEIRATWLRRALRNLIGNALRYGQRARVTLRREGEFAVIAIEDDGPGIPEGSIEAMMAPFIRGDPSRNSTTGGAGLGLALARAIADQHSGALSLTNRKGANGAVEGLTARLALPLA